MDFVARRWRTGSSNSRRIGSRGRPGIYARPWMCCSSGWSAVWTAFLVRQQYSFEGRREDRNRTRLIWHALRRKRFQIHRGVRAWGVYGRVLFIPWVWSHTVGSEPLPYIGRCSGIRQVDKCDMRVKRVDAARQMRAAKLRVSTEVPLHIPYTDFGQVAPTWHRSCTCVL